MNKYIKLRDDRREDFHKLFYIDTQEGHDDEWRKRDDDPELPTHFFIKETRQGKYHHICDNEDFDNTYIVLTKEELNDYFIPDE